MNFYTIVIGSNDHNYNAMLTDRLSKHFQDRLNINVLSIDRQSDLSFKQPKTAEAKNHLLFFLGTAIDGCFHDCGNCRSSSVCMSHACLNSQSISGNKDCTVIHFTNQSQDLNRSAYDELQIKWPAPISEIKSLLETNINSKDFALDQAEQTEASQTADEGLMCMRLMLKSQESGSLEELIKAQLKKGKKIYYLAIMPGWYMRLCCPPDSTGPDLSSLLLSICQHCPPDAAKIGIYTQMHPEGYFQFRPPARGDDLISCEPDHLRKMLTLIRQKVKSENKDTICWVDCNAISIQTAGRLAAICDHILLDLPTDNSYADLTARREAGLLLASLPNSCRIYESERELQEGW